jgi:SecD/SecF fusion protein
MSNSLFRTVLIWAVVVVGVVNIVPTVGWMTLSDDSRTERIERWKEEDKQAAIDKPGAFASMLQGFKRWSEFDRDQVINLGLDLQGGIHMVLSFDVNELDPERLEDYKERQYTEADIQEEVQQVVLQQVRRRVNEFEAKEPIIQALGEDQIQVQLPGEKDLDRARNLITKVAKLQFHIVAGADSSAQAFRAIEQRYPDEFLPFVERSPLQGETVRVAAQNFEQVKGVADKANAAEGVLPEGLMIAFSQPPNEYEDQYYDLYVLQQTPIASGEGLTSASAIPDPSNPPFWQILFEFNNEAAQKFGEATQANINKPMAIVVDSAVLSAPVIRDRISSSGQISGNFEGTEARDLAIALNSGSMVVKLHEEFTRVVGATLGAESVQSGITSAIVGIALVAAFMLVYYLYAGIIAVLSLVVNAILVIAAMAYFNMTLTLPGIAGLILTVGMAVDANVLIFERIREELKLGHTLKASVEHGFQKATSAILDANVTTLLAAVVLFQFGTGPIEGFAVTLSIGVCASVFTALIVVRALFDFVVNRNLVGKLPMLSIVRDDTKIPFLSGRVPAAVISVIVIVIGLAMFGIRGEKNFGVDFTQGTNLMLLIDNGEERVEVGQVREALSAAGFASPVVQESGEGVGTDHNEFLVRVRDIDTSPSEAATTDVADRDATTLTTVAQRMKDAMAPLTKDNMATQVEIEDEQTVGPAVGKQLQQDALLAILCSLIFIVLYLTFRFELKFAVGAVIALAHDVAITIGLFALLGREIDMNVVAAVLTIIGYSLNDTIVVFDRVREDLQVYRGKGYKFTEVLNLSINQTLSRTLLTSLTTLFVVTVLFIFGGEAINSFALALMIGVVVGTYSSVFIASPSVYLWQTYIAKRAQVVDSSKGGDAKKKAKGKDKEKTATAS